MILRTTICSSKLSTLLSEQNWCFVIKTKQKHKPWVGSSQAHSFCLLTSVAALSCMCAQLCLTLCNPMDCSLPGSSLHGLFQARILEWAAISSPRGSFQLRDRTWSPVSPALAGGFFTTLPSGKPTYLSRHTMADIGEPHPWLTNMPRSR